jgi:pantothenate kinase
MTGQLQQDNVRQRVLALTPEAALELLASEVQSLSASTTGRAAIGLAGGPGAGKSTLAADLVAALNARTPGSAALVPMDGFHMRHSKLEALGTVKDKGAPHTFEGAAFVALLQRLKAATGPVSGPGYSRKIEDVVDDMFTVQPETSILVVEGNYLLLAEEPWNHVKPLLDLAVFIDVPREKVRARLLRRHAEEGLFSEERNREHIERVDLANYDRVSLSRPHADLVIELVTEA